MLNSRLSGRINVARFRILAQPSKARFYSTPPQQPDSSKQRDPLHGSYHWIYERTLSIASLGLIAGAFVSPSKTLDFALGIVIPLHSHIGFGAIITDYLPARKFPLVYKLSRGLLWVSTAGVLYGFYLYNTNDLGITEGIRSLWRAKVEHLKDD